MIQTLYRLTAPGMIEPTCRAIDPGPEDMLLRPRFLSICRADQRYYQGNRPPEVLAAKLPMALIHECVATVLHDPAGMFSPGQLVIPVPNVPGEIDLYIAENYLPTSRFRSSGYDGFLREYDYLPAARCVAAPAKVKPEILSFLELVSVSVHAISRFEHIAHGRRGVFGVWGDGNVGFITSLMLRVLYPNAQILVCGTDREKLSYFTFADKRVQVADISGSAAHPFCDHCFECVGGAGARLAINQMIDVVAPEGVISLLGVSEQFPDLNTRMILEKGLWLFGSSRSGVRDFARAAQILATHPAAADYLETLVGEVVPIRELSDIHKAFASDLRLSFGKTILDWKI
jgi:ribitol-5-phosphate 2-dehydrogenase